MSPRWSILWCASSSPQVFGRFYTVLSVAAPIFKRFYAVLPVSASKIEFLSVIGSTDHRAFSMYAFIKEKVHNWNKLRTGSMATVDFLKHYGYPAFCFRRRSDIKLRNIPIFILVRAEERGHKEEGINYFFTEQHEQKTREL